MRANHQRTGSASSNTSWKTPMSSRVSRKTDRGR